MARDIRIGTAHDCDDRLRQELGIRNVASRIVYVLSPARSSGQADLNRNGEVTIAEVTAYINRKVPGAARSTFKQEQQPQILPTLRGSEKGLDTVLTKPTMTFPSDQP